MDVQGSCMNGSSNKLRQGFTILELLVAMTIIVILAAIAITSYSSYTLQSRRSAAQANLNQILSLAQQYFLQNNAFPNYATATAAGTVFTTLPSSITASTFYNYTVNTCGTNCFLASAVVTGTQTSDSKCSCMQIDTNGNRYAFSATNCSGTSTTSTCWTQ